MSGNAAAVGPLQGPEDGLDMLPLDSARCARSAQRLSMVCPPSGVLAPRQLLITIRKKHNRPKGITARNVPIQKVQPLGNIPVRKRQIETASTIQKV